MLIILRLLHIGSEMVLSLKLKNAEIGYTFKSMRLYLRGSNLLTFSKFKLWDPEQGGGNGLKYPTQRVFNIGFQMTIK